MLRSDFVLRCIHWQSHSNVIIISSQFTTTNSDRIGWVFSSNLFPYLVIKKMLTVINTLSVKKEHVIKLCTSSSMYWCLWILDFTCKESIIEPNMPGPTSEIDEMVPYVFLWSAKPLYFMSNSNNAFSFTYSCILWFVNKHSGSEKFWRKEESIFA